MSVRIIFPPQFEPFEPYLSGAYLQGFLTALGVSASAVDANVEFYDWMVDRSQGAILSESPECARRRYLCDHARKARDVLRQTPRSLLHHRWAVNVADEYLRSAARPGVRLGLTHLKVGNGYSSENLCSYLERRDNVLDEFFEFAADWLLGPPAVSTYLLSVAVIDQLPAAIALGRQIKRMRRQAQVLLGGPLVFRLQEQLHASPWLSASFDAIVPGEAARVLPQMLGIAPARPDHVSPEFVHPDLDRYWSCRRVVPYLVAHGCGWGRCSFCSHHLGYDGYRSSPLPRILADLEGLRTACEAEYVSFCDEYLTPRQLADLCTAFVERDLDIRWSTFVRPEKAFTDGDFLARLYAGGCRLLMFGLECASQRVLDLMHKGTRAEHFRTILEACRAANIAIRCDFMVGFPGETEAEVEQTYRFVCDNRDVLDTPFSSYAVAAFELRSGTPIFNEPARFGVRPVKRLRGDLDDQWEYECESGLTAQQRAEWREKLVQYFKVEMNAEILCPQNKTHQLVLKDLHDRGMLRLPVLNFPPERFPNVRAETAPGVERARRSDGWHVINHANGGEIGISNQIAPVFEAFDRGMSLQAAFLAQSAWGAITFHRFISFLYRNDYVWLTELEHENEECVRSNSRGAFV